MDHRSRRELEKKAQLYAVSNRQRRLTRIERLERWAAALERMPERELSTLLGTEYVRPAQRQAMRSEDTAITVAFEDPELRREGLSSDSYGAAKLFFGLTDRQLHFIVCYCQFGPTVRAGRAAERLRIFAPRRGLAAAWRRFWPFSRRLPRAL